MSIKQAREWLKNLSEVYLPAMPIMTKVSWLIETKMADDSDEWKIFDEVVSHPKQKKKKLTNRIKLTTFCL